MERLSTDFILSKSSIARDYTKDLWRKLLDLIFDESRTQAITEETPDRSLKYTYRSGEATAFDPAAIEPAH
jgi:hypothetical protein